MGSMLPWFPGEQRSTILAAVSGFMTLILFAGMLCNPALSLVVSLKIPLRIGNAETENPIPVVFMTAGRR